MATDNQLQIAPLPTTEEVALTLLQWLLATTGTPTDTNQGSIIRTYSEAIGSTEEIEAIETEAQALQALVYSAFTAFGIFPKTATGAVGTATFSTLSTAPLPAGQSVLIPLNTIIQTQGGIQFQTTASAVLVSGTTSINAPIQALVTGATGNVGIGLINQIASGLTYPLGVTNAAPTAGGSDAETASQTLARFMAYVQSLGLCSPVAIAGAVIGVAYQQEVVKYSDVYEHWIDQVASGLAPTPGFQVFIDNGSGSASQNLINTVTTYLSDGPPVGFRPAGVPFCYDDRTEVLTKYSGWKLFKDLIPNETLATLNPSTHELEYNNIDIIHEYDYIGEMIYFDTDMVNIKVTPNHNMYACPRYYDKYGMDSKNIPKNWRFVKADKFKSQHLKCDCKWTGIEKEFYEFDSYKIPMNLWLEFLGYFISEGCTSKNISIRKSDVSYFRKTGVKGTHKKGVKEIKYVVKIDQYDKGNYEKIKKCIDQLPFNFYRGSGHSFVANNKALYEELNSLGKAYEKYIPVYVLECCSKQLRIIYDALCLGDGRVRDNFCESTDYGTTSIRLADQFQELCLKIGYSSNLYCQQVAGKAFVINGKERIHNYDMYYVSVHKVMGLTPRIVDSPTGLSKVMYNGKVYCVTIPNHIIYVRRQGKPVWCGNSVSGVVPIGASVVVVANAINPSIASVISTAITQAINGYFTSLNFGNSAEFTQLVAAIANASFGQLTSLSVTLLDSHGVSQQVITTSPQGQRIILLGLSVTIN